MNNIELHQGRTSRPVLIRPDIDDPEVLIDNNWSCASSVTDVFGNDIIPERNEPAISDDGLYFVVQLSEADTIQLDSGSILREYLWVVRVSNPTLNYSKEQHIHVAVKR